jgi:hypothetical protein
LAALLNESPAPGNNPGVEESGEEADLSERPSERVARSSSLLGRSDSACRKWLHSRFEHIAKGFEAQAERSNKLDDWWNTYNCKRDDNAYYNGDAQVYIPILHDAVNAVVTRYSNQLMPQIGRYVEVTATDGQQPYEVVALVNHYIKSAKFKSLVLKPLIRNGMIEGQYNLYLDWQEISRQIVSRETRGVLVEGPQGPQGPQVQAGAPGDTPDEIVDISEEDVTIGRPCFEVLHDPDVLVCPATADSVEEAVEGGGSVTIVRRYTKSLIKKMAEDEDWDIESGDDEDAYADLRAISPEMTGLKDIEKKLARDVGIKSGGTHYFAFEVWQNVPLNDKGMFSKSGTPRLCKCWYSLKREPIGIKRNPHWNDRVPLLSEPVEKEAGVFKGKTQIEAVAPLQWEANDAANERADVDHMSAMPIIARAPGSNAPLIVAKGAIWEQAPNEVQMLTFPDLSGRATARVQAAQSLIFQSLSVNPAMLPQQSGKQGQKRNQAEVAMEQQVDLLTVAEGVDVLDGLLTEMSEWLVDMDHQYRDRDLTIRQFGELGIGAEMTDVPPLRNRTQYSFSWVGSTQMRMNVAMQQNGTALINTLRGMQDVLGKEGFQLHLGPILEYQTASVFGPVVARQVLRDMRHELAVDPDVENDLLAEGHQVPVNMFDNDAMHLQKHQQFMAANGDPHGTLRIHIQPTMQQLSMKAMAQRQQMMQQGGAPGVPGGAGPGVAGTPRPQQPGPRGTPPGAIPQQPRQMKGPPGMVRPTALGRAGAVVPPRRM